MLKAANAFAVKGRPIQCERHGHGHINATYRLVTDEGLSYVLQKINRHVFKDVPALMHNVSAVTRHLSQADPRPRHSLRLINTHEGSTYFLDDEGEYWRLYDYIPDSICLDRAESKEDFYQSAVAFGTFQNLLADFPAETLHETIPRFHDTPNRYVQFRQGSLYGHGHTRTTSSCHLCPFGASLRALSPRASCVRFHFRPFLQTPLPQAPVSSPFS